MHNQNIITYLRNIRVIVTQVRAGHFFPNTIINETDGSELTILYQRHFTVVPPPNLSQVGM